MKKKDSSSWSEIKSLDERLAREPDSFCFARLSEIYLKVGLVADALHTARQGVAKHPGYLAGQRALAMACNANGLHEESRTLLEMVTAAMPEDTAAQKLLAHMYVDAGDRDSAIRTYATLLDFRPDDVQSKTHLEELRGGDSGGLLQVVTPAEPVASEETAGECTEEEVYDLSEDDIVQDEDELVAAPVEPTGAGVAAVATALGVAVVAVVAAVPAADLHDPLSTLTLAELYEQQGFIAKALDIYRTILADEPSNQQLQAKVAGLEQQVSAAELPPERLEAPESEDEVEPPVPAQFADIAAPAEALDFAPLAHNQADNVVGTLDSWLENIRRIKACR